MIKIVKENPCTDCGIKGLYEHCEEECVQYRKWYQYQQGRADMKAEYESADIPIIHGKSELEEHDKKIRAEAIKELLKEFHPCKYCQSNEDGNCCDKDYFEDCCIEENSISYSELIEFADKLKEK